MLERAMNIVAYRNFPDDVVKKFIYFAKKNGCDYFRIFDALNDLRNIKVPMQAVKENGGHVQACVSYTISPIHTIDYFVDKFIELKKMGARVQELADGMVIHNSKLKGTRVESHHDHRVAMAMAIAALGADGPTTINHAECVDITFPNFYKLLNSITSPA